MLLNYAKVWVFKKGNAMRYLPLHKGESRSIEQSAEEFCRDFIRKDFDKFAKAKQFPREVFRKMGEMGFLGAMIPEKYGGAGMSMKEYVVLMESLACYGGGAIALTLIAHHSLAAAHVIYAGTEEQKKIYLPKMSSGKFIGAWCLTESQAGSDAFGGMQTTATQTETGWRINGSKLFITNGLNADVYIVVARIAPDEPDSKKYGVFIVPKDGKGVIKCMPEENKIGMHESDTTEVAFQDVEVGVDAKMNGDDKTSVYKVLDNSRIGISALACGLLRSALSEAVAYAKERKTFGKPIAERQGVFFPLADAFSEWVASWAMVKEVARAADDGTLSDMLSSATKLKTTKSAFNGCLAAMDVFGGSGYIGDCRATQDWLSARLLRVGEGTDNMQRLTIAKGLFA